VNRTAPSVIVLGATGYTGRLVAARLRREGQPFIVAGRDSDRLAALAADLGELATTHVVNVRDPDALTALLTPGDTVLNCVGPFTDLGEPVVRACIDAGAHYLDTSGEQVFIRAVHDRHGEPHARPASPWCPEWPSSTPSATAPPRWAAAGWPRPIRTADVIYAWRDTTAPGAPAAPWSGSWAAGV
jgi:hypothetical protein